MEAMEYTAQSAVRPLRPTTKKAHKVKEDIPLTPESELMSVEEYFGIFRKRVNDYYDSIQG